MDPAQAAWTRVDGTGRHRRPCLKHSWPPSAALGLFRGSLTPSRAVGSENRFTWGGRGPSSSGGRELPGNVPLSQCPERQRYGAVYRVPQRPPEALTRSLVCPYWLRLYSCLTLSAPRSHIPKKPLYPSPHFRLCFPGTQASMHKTAEQLLKNRCGCVLCQAPRRAPRAQTFPQGLA